MSNVASGHVKTLILVTFCFNFYDHGTDAGLVITPNAHDTFEEANLISSPMMCDNEDLSLDGSNTGSRFKRNVLSGCQWDHEDLTYNVGCVPRKFNRTLVEMDIARAFETWSNYTDLTFTPKTGKVESVTSHILDMSLFLLISGVNSPSYHCHFPADHLVIFQVDIVFRFGNIDGIKNRMAYAFLPCDDLGGEIVFDQEEMWGMIGEGKNPFYRVSVHEIGHALGIEHSNVKPSIMNYGIDNWPESGLPLDDINAIQEIYGPKTGVEL